MNGVQDKSPEKVHEINGNSRAETSGVNKKMIEIITLSVLISK